MQFEAALHAVRQARIQLGPPARRSVAADPLDVRRVVVILASSRGGSSLLFDLLRRTGSFVCLDGEHTPLYKLHGMGLPRSDDTHDGDVLPGADTQGFLTALLEDCTVAGGRRATPDAFACQVARRLVGQWPSLAPLADEVRGIAYARTRRGTADPQELLLDVVDDLCRRGCHVDPRYYDLPAGLVRRRFSGLGPASGPPPNPHGLVEEPPFIVPVPAAPAVAEDFLTRPLLLKASLDAYRGHLIEKLFPGADVQFIHLVRNPAAAVNGLYDGWRDRGFFSHYLAGRVRLDIEGYSDRAWGAAWWNFDLPPGWDAVRSSPLPDVCALQWRRAHQSILDFLATSTASRLRVHAEDFVTGASRRAALREVLGFCRVDPDTVDTDPTDRVLMATSPPQAGRWRERAGTLAPVLADPAIVDMAVRLGYGTTPDGRWV